MDSYNHCWTSVSVHRRRWMKSPLIRLLRIMHECESTTNDSVEYISTPDELSSDVERWRLQPESIQQKYNKMISKHNWHFHRRMRTHSAHEFNPTRLFYFPAWSWQEIRDNIKRPSLAFEWIIIFLQSKWPTSKFCTFGGVWGEVSERIWIRINNYRSTKIPSTKFVESPNNGIRLFFNGCPR